MPLKRININLLTQEELVAYTRALVVSGKSDEKYTITDAIARKYLQTLANDADEFENTLGMALSDDQNKELMEADRIRDKSVLVFRRLMQIYELSEDNSPEAVSYEKLNNLWLNKYDALPYLSLPVETEGIDNLLLEVEAPRYCNDIKTLKLTDSLKKMRATNESFKLVYANVTHKQKVQPVYDVRQLRMELIRTIELFMGYVKAVAEDSDNQEMRHLLKNIKNTTENFSEQLASKHSGAIIEETD